MKKTEKKRRFTLIDLAAILAVLPVFGVLILSSSGAGAPPVQVKALLCRDNLRQIGQAAFAYAEANRDMSIPAFAGNPKVKGWAQLLSGTGEKNGYRAYYACPADEIIRIVPGGRISYNLNTGHLWEYPYRTSSRQEWGPANRASFSRLHGTSVSLSMVEEPSGTLWFFERFMPGSTWENFWEKGDSTHWHSWRIHFWPHRDEGRKGLNNMLFMDGHAEATEEGTWKQGDDRSVVFKRLHRICMGNMDGRD